MPILVFAVNPRRWTTNPQEAKHREDRTCGFRYFDQRAAAGTSHSDQSGLASVTFQVQDQDRPLACVVVGVESGSYRDVPCDWGYDVVGQIAWVVDDDSEGAIQGLPLRLGDLPDDPVQIDSHRHRETSVRD